MLELECMSTDTHFGSSYVLLLYFCILNCLLCCHCHLHELIAGSQGLPKQACSVDGDQ